uniref:Carboxylic ester hydrolase n=1 Tax=Epiphyas postvittana TaxID=65032 RepID=A0A0K8TVB0_EPIPO
MKTVVLIFLALACAASAQGDARESRTVQTAQGPVRGFKTDEIFEFYGIPYATAPTGKNRFKAPLPGPIWMNPLDAVNDKIVCPQGSMSGFPMDGLIERENCLVANVLTPDTEEKNLPVLVIVHGGAYQLGFGSALLPKSLVKTKKMVAVSFNYRLGLHGFLCLGTEGAPGNAGMKDQVALLRWVKENIANFGGNPDDVTIGGYSAGSSAVDLLMLSESTKGLFNKVIPESGANVAVWSIQLDPIENAKEFARTNNFTAVDDINALEEFYTTASFDLLTSDIFMYRKDTTFVASPCMERNIGEETFLEDYPVNIIKQGKYRKVPILYGFANMEGLFRMDIFAKWADDMNKEFSDFLPSDLKFKSESERSKVAQEVKEFYFGDKPVGEDTVQAYIDFFTDVLFAYPHLRSVQLQVEAGSDSIYLYEYSFYSPPPEFEGMPPIPEFIKKIRGANHCAQSGAVHDTNMPFFGTDTSEEFLRFQEKLREMWLNFITTGKPVPEGSSLPAWPPVGANRSPYMDLGEEIKLKGPLLEKRARFWDSIYERYYRAPVPPSPYVTKDEL